MRLDFRNIGKGLEAIAGAKQARDLAQESARYDVTEGAYGPGLQENIQQLQGLREQDPAQAPAYDQAITELTRRQGLTAPDFSVASGPTDFATRQEARQAAAPMRAEGLAGVYRRYGDVAQADALEARAFEQQRGLAAEERAKAAEGRAVTAEARAQQDFATGQTEKGLRINQLTRTEAEQKKEDDLNLFISKNPNADFSTITAQAKTLGMSSAQQFKIASNMTGIGEQEFKASQQRIRKLVENQPLDGLLKAHKESKDLDPNSHFEVIRGKGNSVSLNRVNTTTGQIIQANVFSGNEAEATAYLNKAAMDPATVIDYTMNLEKNKAAIEKDRATTTKEKALAGLYNQGGAGAGKGGLKQKVSDFKEVYGRDPTEAEKGVLAGLVAKDPNKPDFSPEKYAATVKDLTGAGFSPTDALIKADQLYGRGPNTAKEDAALVKDNAAKGGPATPAKTAVGLTPQQMEKAAPAQQPTRAPTTLDAIQSANLEAVSPLAAQFNQARAQLIQASQSKDPNAIAYYMNQQNALRKQLESEVSRRFGNNASTVMQQLAGSM